jgi:carboxylesterase
MPLGIQDLWGEVVPRLSALTQPLVLFTSSEDHAIDASSRELLLRKLSLRQVEECRLENSYHVTTLDYDAGLIFEVSVEFIERVTRNP